MVLPTSAPFAQSSAPSQSEAVAPSRETTTALDAAICTFGESEDYGSQEPPAGIMFAVMIFAGAALAGTLLGSALWSWRKARSR
jgi:hypothetical protein